MDYRDGRPPRPANLRGRVPAAPRGRGAGRPGAVGTPKLGCPLATHVLAAQVARGILWNWGGVQPTEPRVDGASDEVVSPSALPARWSRPHSTRASQGGPSMRRVYFGLAAALAVVTLAPQGRA